jgi:hypothetical protein
MIVVEQAKALALKPKFPNKILLRLEWGVYSIPPSENDISIFNYT